ncbi:hypothetical protein CRYUN_Cryun05aG0201100 [Craigia yunnanensis]
MPLVPSSAMPVGNLAKAFATTVKTVSLTYTLFAPISLHQSIQAPTITPCNFVSALHIPATEIQQTKQHILCPTDRANAQFQSVRAIQTQQTYQEQLLCQANGPHSQLQAVRGVQQGQHNQLLCHNIIASTHPQPVTRIQQRLEQKLHHSNSANIQIQPIRAIQVQQTHQEQLLRHTDRVNTYAQPATGIQQTQQQLQLLKSRSFPPQFSKSMTDLPNSAYNVNGYTESMPTLAVHQQVPQPIHQTNGYTASTPTFAAVPQYIQPPNTTKPGNNLKGHVVQELVDGFIQQAGGFIFESATSRDLPFDLDIGNS